MSSERLANFEQFAIDVILERRKGKRANLLRAGLWFLREPFGPWCRRDSGYIARGYSNRLAQAASSFLLVT